MAIVFRGLTPRNIPKIKHLLEENKVGIIPTDSVFAFVCRLEDMKAVEKICRLKQIKPQKARFSICCDSIQQAAPYASQINNQTFRYIKQLIPGPYTFIFKASYLLPKIWSDRKRSIGIRIPDHSGLIGLIRAVEQPLIVASVKNASEEDYPDWFTIENIYNNKIDFMVYEDLIPEHTSILDCRTDEVFLIRQGKGEV